jgi:predicted nucleic acid-binding protein
MALVVLDTNVLSEPMRSQPDAHVLQWLEEHADVSAICVISAGELLYGVRRLPFGRRREALTRAVEDLLVGAGERLLPFDEAAARAYATLRAEREASGRPISVEDGMIAGICLSRGARLATRNTEDFVGIGVEVVNPWAAR